VAVQPKKVRQDTRGDGMPRLARGSGGADAMEFLSCTFAGGIALDVLTSQKPEGGGAMLNFWQARRGSAAS